MEIIKCNSCLCSFSENHPITFFFNCISCINHIEKYLVEKLLVTLSSNVRAKYWGSDYLKKTIAQPYIGPSDGGVCDGATLLSLPLALSVFPSLFPLYCSARLKMTWCCWLPSPWLFSTLPSAGGYPTFLHCCLCVCVPLSLLLGYLTLAFCMPDVSRPFLSSFPLEFPRFSPFIKLDSPKGQTHLRYSQWVRKTLQFSIISAPHEFYFLELSNLLMFTI